MANAEITVKVVEDDPPRPAALPVPVYDPVTGRGSLLPVGPTPQSVPRVIAPVPPTDDYHQPAWDRVPPPKVGPKADGDYHEPAWDRAPPKEPDADLKKRIESALVYHRTIVSIEKTEEQQRAKREAAEKEVSRAENERFARARNAILGLSPSGRDFGSLNKEAASGWKEDTSNEDKLWHLRGQKRQEAMDEADEKAERKKREGEEKEERKARPRRIADRFNMAGEIIGAAGQGAAAVAGGSAVGAFSSAVGAVSAGLSRLGPYGMAAAAGLQVATSAVGAFKEAVNAFTSRAREIEGYDGRIAGANAVADVRKMNSDMRDADKNGDRYAKLVDAQSKTSAVWDEILMVLKGPLMELLTFGLNAANRTLLAILEVVNAGLPPGVLPEIGTLIKDIKRVMAGDSTADLDKLVRDFFAAHAGAAPPALVPAPVFPGAPLGLPLIP